MHTDGKTQTVAYSATSSGYGANGVTGWHPGGAANDATCSGQITTKFTWTPAYPGEPPAFAIVTQTCTASYNSALGGNGDDGLGDASSHPDAGDILSRTLYTLQSADGSGILSVTCSPSASVSGPTNLAGSATGYASVYYSVSVTPVLLTLSGTTKDASGKDNILIGQGCSGSLSAGPATLSNFQWTVPGDTFASFEVASTASSHYGRVHPVDASEYQKPNPHWFWKKGGDFGSPQTVSCTAHASI